MNNQREGFEKWAYHNKWNIFRVRNMGLDHYVDDFVNGAWEGWQQAQKVTVPEWISVKDRLPDNLAVVLVVFNNGEIDTAIYTGKSFIDTCCACKRWLVTHWQPLPNPPKDTSND